MRDLRQWLETVGKMGELKKLAGASWDLEIGAIKFLNEEGDTVPAILFDDIPGYPKGFRILVNPLDSLPRFALTLNMPDLAPIALVKELKQRLGSLKPIPPKIVKDGPIMENVHTGKDIDVLEFPAPKWNELDGGRYIGTGSVTITQDPDEGWVNLGTYRVMVHDGSTLGFYVSPGKHARIHREKLFARGQPCKVAISLGHDPILFLAGASTFPAGFSEYDFIGGFMGEPVEVIKGPYTGLPIPAASEIVIEGESLPEETRPEGPFGEWTRYYASGIRPEPIIRIKSIMHRNNPILLGESEGPDITGAPPKVYYLGITRAALSWDQMEKAGVPGIKGVWTYGNTYMLVVSIKQLYGGHAKQAASVAVGCAAGAYNGRYVIIVDDDIDPSNLDEVLWAIWTRCDPEKSIDIIRGCRSTPLDPVIPPGQALVSSRALIDACKPFERLSEFPKTIKLSPELRAKCEQKWRKVLQAGG